MAEHDLNKIVDDEGEVFNLRDSTKQPVADRVTAWGSTPSDTKYPSEKLVKTSLDAKGPNVPSEVAIATGDSPLIADSSDGNKVKRANITFDTGVPTTYLCRNGVFNAVKEADVVWGGSFRAELSPAEFGNMARNLVHNPITTAITFEITTDGGTTWTLYERTDPVIRALCNLAGGGAGSQFGLTNALYSGVTDPTTIKGRLTIYAISSPSIEDPEDTWFYGTVKRILVKISRAGDARMKVEYQTWPHFIGDKVWGDVGTFTVMGDSGWNSIPFDQTIGGYSGQLSGGRIIALRFTYWIESGTAPRISVLNIGFLPQIHWKSNAGNIPLLGVPITIHDNGTGRIEYANRFYTARKLAVSLSNTSTDTSFDGSADVTNIKTTGTLAPGNGGTGKTSLKAAEYNLTTGKSEISDTTSGDDRVVFELASPSESNGVTRGFRKLSTIWTWIKGLLSSESGVNISGSSTSCTGNAATATKATQDSDGNAINATYFKSSGDTTLVSGAATKIGTQNGADVKLTLPTIPSGTQLVYDCGTGSTSTTDFDNALAAFNAGNWVIIHSSGNTYHCVGTYNSGLRFKQIANETASIKVNTLNWTRGSAPSVGTQLEPSMPGHTHSQYVEKSGDTMSGNLTISKGANQGDTKFVASRTDTGTTGWFGIGDGGQNHGVYSESAYANTNNDVDKDTKGWVVRTDENGYSTLTGAVDGLFSKYFGNTETLRGMKRFKFGYSLDLEGDYTHVSATAIIEARLYSAGVSGGTITMLFNASAQGDARSYYRLQVLSSNNWNLNSVCPVLIVQQSSATAKQMLLGFVSGGPTSTTLMTFNYTEVKVLPLNGARKFSWSFGWDTNDFNSNTMTMIKPYVYPRAQIGTAVGDANTPVYVKNDGSFGTASGVDVAVALKDAGRGDVAGTSGHIVKVGYDNSSVPATTPSGTSTFAAGATVGTTKNLVTSYRYDGVAFYKDVDSGNVTVGNSLKWNGLNLVMSSTSTPAAATLYIF